MSAETLWAGLGLVLQFDVLVAILGGAVYGLFIGALPGLTATMATALLVPLTFYMAPLPAIALIVSSTAMAITAGDIPGALLRIPGTPASAAYTEESYAMTRRGQAGRALSIGFFFSATGGLIGACVLLITGPLLAQLSLNFSSFEFFWLAVLGLLTCAVVSGDNPAKGGVSLAIGLLISTVGLDVTSGQPRFTLGSIELSGGISFIPVMIGMFAFSEILRGLSAAGRADVAILNRDDKPKISRPFQGVFGLLRRYPLSLLRGTALGASLGALPGVGGDLAAWIAYGVSRRFSKTPEKFGTGHPEGLIEATSANNSGLSSAWIPALVFGIPGDAVTAIAVGVLYMKGLAPGPRLFVENPVMPTAIIMSFFIANLLLFPLGYLAIRGARLVLAVPKSVIVPMILVCCFLGSFAINNTLFGVGIMLVAGLVGYLMERNGFPIAPVILGLVLGPVLERNFIMSMQIARGDLLAFFERPVACGLGLFVCAVLLLTIWRALRRRHIGTGIAPSPMPPKNVVNK
ncbi:tripartite tricarboxylate transporter permease [Marinovum sp. 2_MG-2023]|uniref:tripartite tricarboxylate transporter permease n=1 Tax=unclassified Marinovum TaxID=2647166 RepID=UPI0026E31B16|nr:MULTISPECIES: tripartite tricarboxylate transporter permease [unclassified Marinovum]MDO6731289.1 tripartite tricarboxylate transporter permease [Marinovum sp. 2_MG-2023]MDO6780559.1 tripartite tricarboxylate transporter permease [Marinovum sp. 1_MG-2023]